MKIENKPDELLASLDRVMRLLRRRPTSRPHVGRGIYRILSIVQENKGISTRQLADLLDLRPSSLNERLLNLESEEMLSRVRDPRDQRSFLVQLQAKGDEQLKLMRLEREKMNLTIRSILTEAESSQLFQLSNKLADGLEQLAQSSDLEETASRHERLN